MPDAAPDDHELLMDYCASRAEPAFRELVERHLPAVWSTARRMVKGDGALAEDIAQEVFAHLAVQAPRLPPRVVLGGWLHRHTCFTASKAMRAAARRSARESQHAAAMTAAVTTPDPWPDLAPRLDAALNALSAGDRDAVVLRFFEKRDFRAIAAALGTSEDAARMKTARAVEKLRGLLGKRGGTLLTVALLTGLLTDRSVAAPPAGLSGTVVQTSLARAAAGGAAVSGLTLFFRRLRPLRAAIVGGAFLLLSGFAVWQWLSWTNEAKAAPRNPAAGAAKKSNPAAAPAFHRMDVTLEYFAVPEGHAVTLLADRWTSDDDTALHASLLREARAGAAGVRLEQTLSGTCASGGRLKLGEPKPFEWAWSFTAAEAADGTVEAEDTDTKETGTIAQVEVFTGTSGEHSNVNMTLQYGGAKPVMHRWPTSLADLGKTHRPAAELPEFSLTQATAQIDLRTGQSRLVECTQLPPPPEAPAPQPEERLFLFLTVNAARP